jgi:hypothetical protein
MIRTTQSLAELGDLLPAAIPTCLMGTRIHVAKPSLLSIDSVEL